MDDSRSNTKFDDFGNFKKVTIKHTNSIQKTFYKNNHNVKINATI